MMATRFGISPPKAVGTTRSGGDYTVKINTVVGIIRVVYIYIYIYIYKHEVVLMGGSTKGVCYKRTKWKKYKRIFIGGHFVLTLVMGGHFFFIFQIYKGRTNL